MKRPPALRRFLADRFGATAVLFALSMPAVAGALAIAVDMGSIYLERRELQAASDAAALAAATHSIGDAQEVARAVLAANGFPDAELALVRGVYHEDPAIHRDARFVPRPDGPDVRIDAATPARATFVNNFTGALFRAETRSEAKVDARLSLAVGSRLLALREGLLNDTLGTLLGTRLRLTALDYRALAGATITGNGLVNALPGTETPGRTLGSVLDREITARILVGAIASNLASEGARSGAEILRGALATPSAASATLSLRDLVAFPPNLEEIEVAHLGRALSVDLNVLTLLQAAAASEGITTNIGIGLALPGLVSIDAPIAIGQNLQRIAVGWVGARAETAQLKLQAKLETEGLVDQLGLGLMLPVEAVVASGSATVVEAACSPDPAKRSVTLEVRPGVARLEIGEIVSPLAEITVRDTLHDAQVVRLPRVILTPPTTIDVRSRVVSQDPIPQRLVFRGSEIGSGAFKTVATARALSTLTASLVNDLRITVRVGGFGLNAGLLRNAVSALVLPLAVPITRILEDAVTLAGVRVGEMDVRVDAMSCDTARLVG